MIRLTSASRRPASVKLANWNGYPRSVSIWRPPAHKAITINLSDLYKSNIVTDDVCTARFLCATGVGICWPLRICWKGSLQNNGSIFRSGIHGNWTCNHRTFCHVIWPLSHGARSLRTAWNPWCEMGILTWWISGWPPMAAHSSPTQPMTHPSSRDTTTTTTMTTCRTPFEYRFVCSVVKFSDAFFPLVKSQSVIFTVSQMFFSG